MIINMVIWKIIKAIYLYHILGSIIDIGRLPYIYNIFRDTRDIVEIFWEVVYL